ncbi:MAG: alpha/beta hydrolase [Paracoccaceae bacterium]|jgi:lysophospholipase
MTQPAPFFSDNAGWPEDGKAFWLTASDGVKIRVATAHPAGASKNPVEGTIFMFPGRTEYIEKYGGFARAATAQGFACLCVDWRGQGTADRLISNGMLGHVDVYTDYQHDVAALIAFASEQDLPKPWHMVAHSMSGAIGLRALHNELPVASATFTGPMWDIAISPVLLPLGTLVRAVGPMLGLTDKLTPTAGAESYVLTSEFAGNTLTTDPDMYAMMQNQLRAHPEMALGGPTIGWFSAAISECQALSRLASPNIPCLTLMGSNERIVDQSAVRDRMGRWPGAQFEVFQNGEHEVLMEEPAMRDRSLELIMAHCKKHAPSG